MTTAMLATQHSHFRLCHPVGLIFGYRHLFVFDARPAFASGAARPMFTDRLLRRSAYLRLPASPLWPADHRKSSVSPRIDRYDRNPSETSTVPLEQKTSLGCGAWYQLNVRWTFMSVVYPITCTHGQIAVNRVCLVSVMPFGEDSDKNVQATGIAGCNPSFWDERLSRDALLESESAMMC